MALLRAEDTKLGAQALAYVIEMHQELTGENGAPTLGSQNQTVEFIRADPELPAGGYGVGRDCGDRRSDDGAAAIPAVRPTLRSAARFSRTGDDSASLPLISDHC